MSMRWSLRAVWPLYLLVCVACNGSGGSDDSTDAINQFLDASEGIDRVRCDCDPRSVDCTQRDQHKDMRRCLFELFSRQREGFHERVECYAEHQTKIQRCFEEAECNESLMSDCFVIDAEVACGHYPASLGSQAEDCHAPFVCGDGREIDHHSRCDTRKDCADGSDEDCSSFRP